ncbi:MAG: NAD(+)/NADH kinase [Bacillota bacterium]
MKPTGGTGRNDGRFRRSLSLASSPEGGPKLIGIYPNLDKPQALQQTVELAAWLTRHGYDWVVSPEVASAMGAPDRGAPVESWTPGVNLVLVLGGDGTLLNAARRLRGSVPLLGVNLGHLGFLTELELPELYDELPGFLQGHCQVDARLMIEASVVRSGDAAAHLIALNEFVIAKGPFARLMRLEVRVNQNYVDTYHADGLIVATPTGSTAYSLSAGGPLVSPGLDALVITPICPHTLYSRSMVVAPEETITVCLPGAQPGTVLTADGQSGFHLAEGDRISVQLISERVRLLRRPGWSFYEVLRRKLRENSQPET